MNTELPRVTRVEPLKEGELFAQVAVDRFGAICWPNGADLAPDALHARLTRNPTPRAG